ncbi:MAG: response regulator [Spirochaetales bacterium]|nr:response regulator [Exilispira sp.]NMC67976.1 response regulator [Spirochaetales bacterium]
MQKKVLVVDDVLVILDFVKMVLEMNNYKVITCLNGYEAIEHIKKDDSIGLILLDLMMPEISGWDTLREIRKIKSKEQLPVIIFTGNVKEREQLENNPLKNEILDFILKPVSYEDLIRRIEVVSNTW